jgi:hypothetical protein
MARPLRCRLRLHALEYRENPRHRSTTKSAYVARRIETKRAQPFTVEDPGVSAAGVVERMRVAQGQAVAKLACPALASQRRTMALRRPW